MDTARVRESDTDRRPVVVEEVSLASLYSATYTFPPKPLAEQLDANESDRQGATSLQAHFLQEPSLTNANQLLSPQQIPLLCFKADFSAPVLGCGL